MQPGGLCDGEGLGRGVTGRKGMDPTLMTQESMDENKLGVELPIDPQFAGTLLLYCTDGIIFVW